ncbi:MAG: PadR family transcriptional regulator [Thomasclavelia sp.]
MAKVNSNIDMLILSILNKKDCYGYELVKLIKTISDNNLDIKEGTLYPIIYNLLNKNYISSYNIPNKNRIRVYYRIEDTGREYLVQCRKQYIKTHTGIMNILNYGEDKEDEE